MIVDGLYCPPKGVEPGLIDVALFVFGGAFPGLAERWLPAAVGMRDANFDEATAAAPAEVVAPAMRTVDAPPTGSPVGAPPQQQQ